MVGSGGDVGISATLGVGGAVMGAFVVVPSFVVGAGVPLIGADVVPAGEGASVPLGAFVDGAFVVGESEAGDGCFVGVTGAVVV